MKKFITFVLLLALSLPAVAVPSYAIDGDHVKYIGGTETGINTGIVGHLNTTSDTSLTFDYAGKRLEIPYASIESSEYTRDVAHHLGVLPFIAIGLLRMRQHRHFFRISYRDSHNVVQVVIFEVPKQMPRTLKAVLDARSPRTVTSYGSYHPCVVQN